MSYEDDAALKAWQDGRPPLVTQRPVKPDPTLWSLLAEQNVTPRETQEWWDIEAKIEQRFQELDSAYSAEFGEDAA